MKKALFLIPFLFLALTAGAQDFQTEIALVEVLDFNGKTLPKAPAGKSQTLQLVRTKYSKPLENYTSHPWMGRYRLPHPRRRASSL